MAFLAALQPDTQLIWNTEPLPQVFDGAVIILSLAPMVASTVANGPRSPWDAISLIIMFRIWRVKRVIDGEYPEGVTGSCPLENGGLRVIQSVLGGGDP